MGHKCRLRYRCRPSSFRRTTTRWPSICGRPLSAERRCSPNLSLSTSSADLLAEAYYWQALNYFEAGQLEDLETLLEQYESLSTARFGLHQYWAGAYRVT